MTFSREWKLYWKCLLRNIWFSTKFAVWNVRKLKILKLQLRVPIVESFNCLFGWNDNKIWIFSGWPRGEATAQRTYRQGLSWTYHSEMSRNVILQVESVIIKANLFFTINKTRIFLAQFKEFSASFIKPDLFPSNPMVDIKKMFTFSSKSKLQLNYFSPAGVRMLQLEICGLDRAW